MTEDKRGGKMFEPIPNCDHRWEKWGESMPIVIERSLWKTETRWRQLRSCDTCGMQQARFVELHNEPSE